MNDKPRLIEVAFPLKQASLTSVHEKNVRHGHISTLHIWPARRPLAASRAALLCTLLPDPGDAQARQELLDLIGGTVVKRVVTLEDEEGNSVSEEKEVVEGGVLAWGRWVLERAKQELASRYPTMDGEPTVAYLWARTARDPQTAGRIPLLKTFWLCRKNGKRTALLPVPLADGSGVSYLMGTRNPHPPQQVRKAACHRPRQAQPRLGIHRFQAHFPQYAPDALGIDRPALLGQSQHHPANPKLRMGRVDPVPPPAQFHLPRTHRDGTLVKPAPVQPQQFALPSNG
jgi:adenine-specific DNA methylase